MAEEIDNLFVRLGLEKDDAQFKDAERSFSSLRSTALQFGAAIGAGFGLNELTFGFARTVNEANKLSEVFEGLEVTPQFVSNLEGAFRLIDEDASEAAATIQGIADLIEDTDWGEISDQAFARGFDISGIQDAENMTEAMAALNEQIRAMEDPEDARRLASALGLSDAQFRLFRQTDIGEQMGRAEELNPLSNEQAEAARRFQEGANELSMAMSGISGALSELFVEDLGAGMSELADLMAENRDAIAEFADNATPYLAAAATGIGTLVALRAGRAAIGAFSNIPGATALAAGIGVGVYQLSKDGIDERTQQRLNPAAGATGMYMAPLLDFSRDRDEGARFNMFPRRDYLEEMFPGINDDLMSPLDMNDFQGSTGGNTNSLRIDVDARGSSDPLATESAVERGVNRAIERAAETTILDFRSSVS